MKFLVIGGGSMGKRRIRCLMAGGVPADRIRLVDPRADRREESQSKYNVVGFADLQTAMQWNPATVLVCIAGEKAGEVSAIALESGKNVFCEVPMGMTAAEARRLGDLARRQGVLAAPGAQQPFHPLVIQCRQWLRDPSFGKPLLFNLEWGQYMPGWHPYEDLGAFYSPGQLLGVMNLELVSSISSPTTASTSSNAAAKRSLPWPPPAAMSITPSASPAMACRFRCSST